MGDTTFILIIFFIFLLSISPTALASPSEDLASGIEYFTQGDYSRAKKLFIRAQKKGLNSPELTYNLGSVYYKLEQYRISKKYFEKLRLDKNLGYLAHYNLGLIEHKLGRDKEALEFFEISALLTDDREWVSLSRKQIDTIRTSDKKSWIGYVSTRYGFDSNVLASSSASTSQSASLFRTLGFIDWKLSKGASDRFHVLSSIYSNNYSADQNRDEYSFSLGFEYRASISNWKFSSRLNGKKSVYAGDDYLSTTQFAIKARNQWSQDTEIRIQLKQEEISSLSNQFDHLEGDRSRFNIRLRHGSKQREFRYEYEHERNDRQDTDFSPTRDQFAIQYYRYSSKKLRTGVKIEYRVSDYEPVGTQDRERARLKLDYKYQADETWTIIAEFLYTNNRSTDPVYEYDKYTVVVGVSALF